MVHVEEQRSHAPGTSRSAHPHGDTTQIALRFGEILRLLRSRRGYSQIDLADRSRIHRSHVSLIEQGHRDPRLTTICALAIGLRVNPADLMPVLIPPDAAPAPPAFRSP